MAKSETWTRKIILRVARRHKLPGVCIHTRLGLDISMIWDCQHSERVHNVFTTANESLSFRLKLVGLTWIRCKGWISIQLFPLWDISRKSWCLLAPHLARSDPTSPDVESIWAAAYICFFSNITNMVDFWMYGLTVWFFLEGIYLSSTDPLPGPAWSRDAISCPSFGGW